ncbi:hypothetical protein P7K49_006305 [Saguinus oedipus]|uniref:Uncharacterized protein n=1 Tax=Saguinus oedipus TaxID=9490 RepID=A0ABQ9W221_SAGOE|nr:hypothetical protein P7K49_006305 [Saguinus oedipus]
MRNVLWPRRRSFLNLYLHPGWLGIACFLFQRRRSRWVNRRGLRWGTRRRLRPVRALWRDGEAGPGRNGVLGDSRMGACGAPALPLAGLFVLSGFGPPGGGLRS